MTQNAPRYDVAISFLAQDENLALDILERLKPLKVFVYSKAQEHLAGTDGTESFRRAFQADCRVMLVLHRDKWGTTKWTRVEEMAIRDRCFESGWDSLLFVTLDDSARPKWLPGRHIRLDFDTFGIADLVGAVRARAAEHGATLRPVSAADRAEQMVKQAEFEKETDRLLGDGQAAFMTEFAALQEAIIKTATEVCERAGWHVSSGRAYYLRGLVVRMEGVTLHLPIQDMYANTARDAHIDVATYDMEWPLEEPGKRYALWDDHFNMRKPVGVMHLRRSMDSGWCWEMVGAQRKVCSNEVAAEYLVNAVLDRISEKAKTRR